MPAELLHSQTARPPPLCAPSGATHSHCARRRFPPASQSSSSTSLFADHSAEPRTGSMALTDVSALLRVCDLECPSMCSWFSISSIFTGHNVRTKVIKAVCMYIYISTPCASDDLPTTPTRPTVPTCMYRPRVCMCDDVHACTEIYTSDDLLRYQAYYMHRPTTCNRTYIYSFRAETSGRLRF